MKNLKFTIFILCAITMACTNCTKRNTSNHNEDKKINKLPLLDSLSNKKITQDLLLLSPQAQENLKNFDDLQTLSNLIKMMKNSNAFYIQKYTDTTDLAVNTLRENISNDLNTRAISSRLTVLETETALLRHWSEKKMVTEEKLLEANTRLIKAYNSLIIQLNELSLAIPDNIQKELLGED
ncbi:hypothetical protein ACE939_12420 [Aquimarina sp. W85]|uniref:hypothetical protein n=1 Tax=Aquimarina rhodophyticola TaxID=3342246 RepID=UPI0036713E52